MKRLDQLTQLTAAQLAQDDIIGIRDQSAGQTKYITVKDLTGSPDLGWVATGESWTFSSWNATTHLGVITVPTDATVKYRKGMWVRIAQTTGGTKYGMITAVTATTLTVNMFSYTLNNEAITSPVYSPLASPIGATALPYVWTEANGWTVWDYGTERRIFRTHSFTGAAITAGAFSTRSSGIAYPSGYTISDMVGSKAAGNDQALSLNFDHVAGATAAVFDCQNVYTGGSVTPTIVWAGEFRVVV